MVAMIWQDKFAIIDANLRNDVYQTLVYTKHDEIDGDPEYFSEEWGGDEYDSEIILENFIYKEILNDYDAYRWLIEASFGDTNV